MTPAEIYRAAGADGVIVTLSAGGAIKATGEQSAVNRWRPALVEHKAEIIKLLNDQPDGSATTTPAALPSWCDPECSCLHRLELPGYAVVMGCYQEDGTSNWKWLRLDKINCCPRRSREERIR